MGQESEENLPLPTLTTWPNTLIPPSVELGSSFVSFTEMTLLLLQKVKFTTHIDV